MTKVSLIIPVFNAELYLRRCLDSVLRQSLQDFQVILVNDGSTDNSLSICRQYSQRDPRFIILDKPNGGAATARNMGLDWFYQNGSTPWLCFLDADDFAHERYLETLYSAALSTNLKISMCSYELTQADTIQSVEMNCTPKAMATEALWCQHQLCCTIPVVKLFARDLFRDIRFPEGIIHEDEFTLYRVLFQCDQIAYVDLPLYGYYQTETSVMRGAWTPRHMTEPDGLFAQLSFFEENNYQQAAAYTARIYLLSLYNNFVRCKAAGNQYAEYAAALKKRLHTELGHYHKLAGVSIESEPWLFYEVRPFRTIPYRVLKKLKNKSADPADEG